MKKGTQAALSFAAGYLILRIGVAIHRHPVGSAVVLTILIIGYAIDGASAPEVVSTARSIGFIYGLVFIIGLACAGRWIAALCWFVALFLCVEIVQSWIECTAHICYYIERHWYASKLAVNGLYESSLGNYEWWTNHGQWLPSPASVCVCLLLYAVAVIVDRFFPHRQPVAKSERNEWKHTIPIDGTSVAKSKRPPPTFENVRLVAEVLSRLNAQLIEKHFNLDADTAREYMERLVEEGHFGKISADGWHYPLKRQERLRRSSAQKPKAKPKVADSVAENVDRPGSADMSNRICELEGEVQALRARVKRLQRAGKTIIAQREAWMARALAAEREAMELTTQLAGRLATRDSRYDALRRLIARELHPDHCTGGEIEKLVRAEFFKSLWPEIEQLAERAG